MECELENARRIVREIEDRPENLPDWAREAACLLLRLAEIAEAQQCKLAAAVHALNYYRDPSLYYAPGDRPEGTPILDDGLRARTALGLIEGKTRNPLPLRVPLPQG